MVDSFRIYGGRGRARDGEVPVIQIIIDRCRVNIGKGRGRRSEKFGRFFKESFCCCCLERHFGFVCRWERLVMVCAVVKE